MDRYTYNIGNLIHDNIYVSCLFQLDIEAILRLNPHLVQLQQQEIREAAPRLKVSMVHCNVGMASVIQRSANSSHVR